MYILVAILLVIVIIFGISSGLDSFATAKQAEATIEVAKVAQVNAWGNLVTILTVVLLIVVFMAIAAAVLYTLYTRAKKGRGNNRAERTISEMPAPALPAKGNLDALVQLATLQLLQSMMTKPTNQALPAPREEEPADDLSWLR